MKKMLLFLTFCFAFGVELTAQVCDCTVDEVQNNLVDPCDFFTESGDAIVVSSVESLWDAIHEVNEQGGDMTILIEDGTYPIASTAAFPYITASNVVIRSLSGNRDAVIITGGGMQPAASTENGFLIAGNAVAIANLTIRDVGNHAIQVSGNNLFVYNVRIQNTYEQMIKGSTAGDSINGALVQCSLFEYTAGVGPNYYIGGLDIHKGNYWTVRDNVFKNIASPADFVAEHAIHFWNNSSYNSIERNLIVNCDRGIGFGLGTNGLQNDGGIIRNNMIYNEGTGLFNDVGIGLESSPNVKVYNNTVYIQYQNAIEYRFETTNNVEVVNNLTNKAITARNGATADVHHNVTDALADWFVDVNTGDLHLSTGPESVVDQGLGVSFVLDDIDKTPRPLDGTYDIGAHEYLLTSTSSIRDTDEPFLYPNPASSFATIKTSGLRDADVVLYDALGKEFKVASSFSEDGLILHLETLANGVYWVLIKKDNLPTSRSLLVKH